MEVYDKAYELKRALSECNEVKDYKNAWEKIKSNPTNKKMLDDFMKKQMEIQAEQYAGKEPAKEKVEQVKKLYSIISMNYEISNFMQCEYKFEVLMNDISKIISEAVDIGVDFNLDGNDK